MDKVDNLLYFLEHHNKNLTKQQEAVIADLKEYINGKYGVEDFIRFIENGHDVQTIAVYADNSGERVYSKSTLIGLIHALAAAIEDMSNTYSFNKEAFNGFLIERLKEVQ